MGDLAVVETLSENVVENDLPYLEVYLSSVMGLISPKTMRMEGEINGSSVVVMINAGATHNFISTTAAQNFNIQVIESKNFGVTLGTGETVQGGVCRGVLLELQGVSIVEDFLILPLGNSDIILGIQWLEKLGTTTTNWKTHTLKFQVNGVTVTLKGDPQLGRTGVSLKAMIKNLQKEGQGYLLEMNQLEGEVKNEPVVPALFEPLINEFQQVFHMPEGLPPPRQIKHAIVLRSGTDPIVSGLIATLNRRKMRLSN